ncbi:phosphatases II [Ascobolus immersus RN42]|uniref:Phosphatases II n=1 Tax=Ascobolus immersus RN42 TaxID=1160509 RepID=A0A3N4IGG8_ASCIM|nr:phosphatases II [Ascobolus immersus RN42]
MTDPLPTTMNKLPGERIYVGSLFAIREPNSLQEAGITHILTLLDTSFRPPPTYETVTLKQHVGPESHSQHDSNLLPISETFSSQDPDSKLVPTHLVIPLHDYPTSPLLPYLADATSYIRQALASNNNTGTVLVHCTMGRSRSCAVAAAYLISISDSDNRLTVQDALLKIKKARPSMNVSSGFVKQLEIWRSIGCPSTRARLEASEGYQKWKRGKEEKRQKRAEKDRADKRTAKRLSQRDMEGYVNEKDMKHWKKEGELVEKAIEKLDGQLGGALKRNTEIAARERANQLNRRHSDRKMDDPSQVHQSGSTVEAA